MQAKGLVDPVWIDDTVTDGRSDEVPHFSLLHPAELGVLLQRDC